MKVAFLGASYENLGIEYLSAYIKQKGHKTRLFLDPKLFNDTYIVSKKLSRLFSLEDEKIAELIDYNPEMICISVISPDYQWAKRVAMKIRKKTSAPIVFGGIHPSSVPKEVLKNKAVDFVVIGEGEQTLLELIECIKYKREFYSIKGLGFKDHGNIIINPLREPIKDLDTLPFPDKELYYSLLPSYKKGYTIMTARGCPNRCTYCYNSLYKNYMVILF